MQRKSGAFYLKINLKLYPSISQLRIYGFKITQRLWWGPNGIK